METTRAFAERFLWVWGDQMRVRMASSQSRTPYIGNIDAGTFKPKDDPHAHAFVICQVEKCLNGLGPEHGDYAWHLYVNRHRRDDYHQSRRFCDRLREEVITALVQQMQSRRYERISDREAAAIMAELRARRAQGRR